MTLEEVRQNRPLQTGLGLAFGIVFGFLLERGGATEHAVIWGQLLLYDFTVVKIMASAVLVGMIGFALLRSFGLAEPHVADPSLGTQLAGGLVFGLLGLCPGTMAGAIGRGSIDALVGGAVGLVIGTGLFATVYPRVGPWGARTGRLPWRTVADLLGGVNPWVAVVPVAILILVVLGVIEYLGL
ncbi:MAG: YeeE/YedE thiosulfate transporter family protein [Methanospirillum sp.]